MIICSFKQLLRIGIISTALSSTAYAAVDNEAPTKPGDLTANPTSESTIALNWLASTDNRRVRQYKIYVNGVTIDTTGNLNYEITGLQAETLYEIDVSATDGRNESFLASTSTSTLAGSSSPEPDQPSSTGNGKGKGKNKPKIEEPPTEEPPTEEPPIEEPPTEEPPTEEPPTEEPPTEEPPTEEPPTTTGVPAGWKVVFNDEFDGYGDVDVDSENKLWRFEGMDDGLHRAGNSGMDEFGNTDVPSWQSPKGKRWSAWYNHYQKDNAYRSDGNLVMQGLSSGEADPTRPNDYYDNGILTQYGSSKLYTAWLDTWARKWDESQKKHITDPASPGKSFKYGYFETRVNFSQMITPGFRLSMWLMPASSDADGQNLVVSNAYDEDGNNGVEIDIFEYEWINTAYENHIQLSLHGGSAGSSATSFDASTIGLELHQGYHTIGFLWQADKLVWTIDGIVAKTVTDPDLIPDVYSYFIISREMNSGVKRSGHDNVEANDALEVLPYRPRDPGLFAQNIWEFRDRIATDRALVDYVRIWQP